MAARHLLLLSSILLLCQPAVAAEPSSASGAGAAAPKETLVPAVSGDISGRNFIGAVVRDDRGNDVGEVYDLIVDPDTRVTDAVIALGGPLDFDRRLVRVPYSALAVSGDAAVIIAPLPQTLSQRPTFIYPEDQQIRILGAMETPAPNGQSAQSADEMRHHVDRAGQEVQEWGQRVDEFVGKVQRQGSQAAQNASRDVAQRWSEVEKRWQTLKNASQQGWDEAKKGFDRAWNDFVQTWQKRNDSAS